VRTRDARRVAARFGLVVRLGGKHYRIETPDGQLVAVTGYGKRRERAPTKPEQFLEAQIVKGLRRLEEGGRR
jgi:hypothetical protein